MLIQDLPVDGGLTGHPMVSLILIKGCLLGNQLSSGSTV
ncbi:hypothetical protein XCR1_1650001 [Xenorhabdus cabanillasii JM26]|uniref:Uncharacterized protein n=1 Tax=Xenorhabdus cabanillasii JM26 TaxID=1427517 RepID=W1IY47_9GAMM|nr:hypothetical protein XCR1_1650001 [Xenorhabdus cabanillasii JM26]